MRRHGFFGIVGFAVAFTFTVATANSCSEPEDDGEDEVVDSGSVGSNADLEAYIEKHFERCQIQTFLPTDFPTADSVAAARAAIAANSDDISLSPDGCRRLRLTRKNGAVVSQTFIGAPFLIAVDPTTYETHYRAATTSWEYSANKTVMTSDSDADGYPEVRVETVPGVRTVLERREPGDVVLSRTTTTASDNKLSLDIVEESLVSGALVTVATYSVPALQRTCLDPADKPLPPSTPGSAPYPPCGDADKDKAMKLIEKAVGEQANCLSAMGKGYAADVMLDKVVHSRFEILCTNEPDFVAGNNRGYHDLFGDAQIVVNPILFTGVEGYQTATMGHELYHFVERHDPEIEATAHGDQNVLRMIDPVYACEFACFNANATTCHLAVCMGKKIGNCPDRLDSDTISRMEQFRGKPLQPCTTGHQVGAVCRNTTGGKVQFCTTMAECNPNCSSKCESKSVSCNPNCR